MLMAGLLASAEHGLNRVLRMDSTALPRLAALEGKVIEIDCRQPAKTAVLHSPQVQLHGDTAALLDLFGILQDLELDWEHELQKWLGPVPTSLIAGHIRLRTRWTRQGLARLSQSLSEYLAEESRTLVGKREAEAAFSELDAMKVDTERLEARILRLSRSLDSSDNA